jgi:hypothetical protein
VNAGRKGELMDPHFKVTNTSWKYTGDLLPPAKTTQWIVDWSCNEKQFYKDISAMKMEIVKAGGGKPVPSTNRNKWWSNVFWDAKTSLVSVRDRPLLLHIKGETFWSRHYGECPQCDLALYRAKTLPSEKCLNMHFVNGIAHFSTRYRNFVEDLADPGFPGRTGISQYSPCTTEEGGGLNKALRCWWHRDGLSRTLPTPKTPKPSKTRSR